MASGTTSVTHAWRRSTQATTHDETPWLIDTPTALDAWRRRLRTFTASDALPVVQLRMDGLSASRNRSFTTLAAEYRDACGCATGGLFMGAATIVAVAGYFIAGHRLSEISFGRLGLLLGIVVGAALSGKLLGLLIARWRLIRLADRVRRLSTGTST